MEMAWEASVLLGSCLLVDFKVTVLCQLSSDHVFPWIFAILIEIPQAPVRKAATSPFQEKLSGLGNP